MKPKWNYFPRKQKGLEDAKSVQMSSSFLPVVAQHSLASQVSAKTEPRRIQNFYFSERDECYSLK